MDYLSRIFDAILTRTEQTSLFTDVQPALRDGQLSLPAAEVWLEEMKLLPEQPEPTYDLVFVVQITVGHKEDGSAQASLHPLLATMQHTFHQWETGFVGVLSATVPGIKLAAHEDKGKTIYLMQIELRVSVDTFGD